MTIECRATNPGGTCQSRRYPNVNLLRRLGVNTKKRARKSACFFNRSVNQLEVGLGDAICERGRVEPSHRGNSNRTLRTASSKTGIELMGPYLLRSHPSFSNRGCSSFR